MKGEETLDELRLHGLMLRQFRCGYRFSLDPLLLCSFAAGRVAGSVIDLGTGCGVIPLVLARTAEGVQVTGVEVQQDMAELASRNVSLNGLAERVSIVHDDVLNLRRRFPVSSFDLVVANPPFRRPGTGRLSPRAGRDLARHESTATLEDFLAAAKYLVKPQGSICLVHHPSRLADLICTAAGMKLSPARLRMVHGKAGDEARIVLVEFLKGRKAGLRVLPPLLVYGEDGEYTEEAAGILGTGDRAGNGGLGE